MLLAFSLHTTCCRSPAIFAACSKERSVTRRAQGIGSPASERGGEETCDIAGPRPEFGQGRSSIISYTLTANNCARTGVACLSQNSGSYDFLLYVEVYL